MIEQGENFYDILYEALCTHASDYNLDEDIEMWCCDTDFILTIEGYSYNKWWFNFTPRKTDIKKCITWDEFKQLNTKK